MTSAGYIPLPCPPDKKADAWSLPEGWVLQPWVPSEGMRRPVIVGRCTVYDGLRRSIKFNPVWFREAPMNFEGELLLGTLVMGTRRRDRAGHIVVHDVVSELPLFERMALMKRRVPRDHLVVTLALPEKPSAWYKPEVAVRDKWPEVGWLAKKVDAPVRLGRKHVEISDSWVHLDRAHVISLGKKNPPCWATPVL